MQNHNFIIWYYDHFAMVLRPLKYGVITILTLASSNIIMIFQPLKYVVTTILTSNFQESKKNILLRSFLIFKWTLCLKRDYDINNILYFEETWIIEMIMLLRPTLIIEGYYILKEFMVLKILLILKGWKNETERIISRRHEQKKEKIIKDSKVQKSFSSCRINYVIYKENSQLIRHKL